jgi:elongation factor Ts
LAENLSRYPVSYLITKLLQCSHAAVSPTQDLEKTMSVSAQDVKKLRDITGAGMMDCKKALAETNGDLEQAIDFLRKKGQKISDNRADRDANEGAVFVAQSADGKKGVLIELNCETDFVARNEDFQALGKAVAQQVLDKNLTSTDQLDQVEVDGKPLSAALLDAMTKIGEKIAVSKVEVLEAEKVVSYIHIGGRVGVLVGLTGTNGVSNIAEVGKDVAMQIAAMNPVAVGQHDVDAETVERERAIAIELMNKDPKNANKPEDIRAKILEGMVQKFYKERTLLNQEFVKDSSKSVDAYLKSNGKDLTVTAFKRVGLGA